MNNKKLALGGAVLVAALIGYGLMNRSDDNHLHGDKSHAAHEQSAEEEFERGPRRGRLLKKDNFSLEVTVYEEDVPPQFRFYAYEDGEPVDPSKVQLTVTLKRLDGEVNVIHFAPESDYLKGDSTVVEPHSFDVNVESSYDGESYTWQFASYEGRTTIDSEAAKAAGVATEPAGPAIIHVTVPVTGRIALNRNRTAEIHARFPGIVREVLAEQGQTVAKGDILARIESNDSLQVYNVIAPISGTVLSRNVNVGAVAGTDRLFQVADLSELWAEFHVFSRHAAQVSAGQKATVKATEGLAKGEGVIVTVLPLADQATQTVIVRVPLPNPDGVWRPGMAVLGEVTTAEHEVPLSVRNDGLQRFRDFTVVFAQVGDTYEVRMLEMGASDGEWTEVLSGIKPGQAYVSKNSFLIKADIEKSGASHDH